MKATGTHSALTNSALRQESWFFGEVRRWLAANTTIRGLVMFSDPEMRTRNDGSVLLPGPYVGTSYQASNAPGNLPLDHPGRRPRLQRPHRSKVLALD